MPIGPMDEFRADQIAETFDLVYTSDRNFYDRYYFNMHDSTRDFFMVVGMGQYPNLGATDAFATISHGTNQYTVRASRTLGHDRLDTQVGLFRIEVIEGLQSPRFSCDDNEWGLHFDVRFDGSVRALEEPKTFQRNRARVARNVSRYAQVGNYTGTATVAGHTYAVTPDMWKDARGRSWGVRPVGKREAPRIAIEGMKNNVHGFYHNWIPLQIDRGMYKVMYDAEYAGNTIVEECAFIPAIGEPGEIKHFGTPQIEMDFISGTREMKSARTIMPNPDGEAGDHEHSSSHGLSGRGYGLHRERRVGPRPLQGPAGRRGSDLRHEHPGEVLAVRTAQRDALPLRRGHGRSLLRHAREHVPRRLPALRFQQPGRRRAVNGLRPGCASLRARPALRLLCVSSHSRIPIR